jgi:hypothetical protein
MVPSRIWPFLAKVSVLLVMDGRPLSLHYASFGPGDPSTNPGSGDQYFGLSEFVNALTGPIPFLSSFAVTKAHRDTDVGNAADIVNFRFDQHDLSAYDEIWLFGLAADASGTGAPMTDSELAALAAFMDGGGGVFATGDHENLGVVLCGRVPRVRSMRKWYFPNPGPNGEPPAPPALGVGRIETTQPGHNDPAPHGVLFDDQSDDIPQPILPRFYTLGGPFFFWRYPHPLLCGPRGTITVLPDHMHEGEVITPWDSTASFTFSGKTFVEYPKVGAVQPLPEIVAWGTVLPEVDVSTEGAHVGDPGDVATPRTFGVVGAYDGHPVSVGRVAVDSTWHHFFDINLIGDPVAPAPKSMGFRASPAGQAALADIEAYYRNIAVWIARPEAQAKLFGAAAWFVLRTQPLNMLVTKGRKFTLRERMDIGRVALDCLYRVLPPCAALQIFFKQYVAGPGPVPLPDPWAGPSRDPSPDPVVFAQVGLAGAVIALGEIRDEVLTLPGQEAADRILEAARRGMLHGLRELGHEAERVGNHLAALGRKLAEENTERK